MESVESNIKSGMLKKGDVRLRGVVLGGLTLAGRSAKSLYQGNPLLKL